MDILTRIADGLGMPDESRTEFVSNHGGKVELYWYSTLAGWRLAAIDSVLYVSSFDQRREGHESQITKIVGSPGGALYAGFNRMLAELLATSERVV